jgi:hypothetical protein
MATCYSHQMIVCKTGKGSHVCEGTSAPLHAPLGFGRSIASGLLHFPGNFWGNDLYAHFGAPQRLV